MMIIKNELYKPETLICEIDYFCCSNGYHPHYLVMNRDTYNFLTTQIKDYTVCYCTSKNERKIYDIDVAFCDSLKFGEVDVV